MMVDTDLTGAEQSEQLRLRYAQLEPSLRENKAYCAIRARVAAEEGDVIGAILFAALAVNGTPG